MNSIKNQNIFLIGPMGAGKSTIGKALAKAVQKEFYDSDQVIEARSGASVIWIFDVEGPEGFRKREERVIDELTQKSNIVLATGGGAILSPNNRLVLASRGLVVYLKTSLVEQFSRTKNDTKRPLLQTDNLMETLEELKEERERLYEALADVSFETDNLSVKAAAANIVKYLSDIG